MNTRPLLYLIVVGIAVTAYLQRATAQQNSPSSSQQDTVQQKSEPTQMRNERDRDDARKKGRKREFAGSTADHPDLLKVRIRPTDKSDKCSVDFETVNLRKTVPGSTGSDQITWCTDVGRFSIVFPNATPFKTKTIPVSDDDSGGCSQPQKPVNVGNFTYEVHNADLSNNPACDPNVVVK